HESPPADLSSIEARDCDFSGAKLGGAAFIRANLTNANFTKADLSGADLRHANATGAVLDSANLTGANFNGAILRGAVLTRAKLAGAELRGVDISGAILDPAALGTAITEDLKGASLRSVSAEELKEILSRHRLWPDSHGKDGARAMLSDCDLSGATLGG